MSNEKEKKNDTATNKWSPLTNYLLVIDYKFFSVVRAVNHSVYQRWRREKENDKKNRSIEKCQLSQLYVLSLFRIAMRTWSHRDIFIIPCEFLISACISYSNSMCVCVKMCTIVAQFRFQTYYFDFEKRCRKANEWSC